MTRDKDRVRIVRAERRERGLCLQCGGKNDRFPKWFCSKCLSHHNEQTSNWARKAKRRGLCSNCGRKRDRSGWICTSCLTKERLRRGAKRNGQNKQR